MQNKGTHQQSMPKNLRYAPARMDCRATEEQSNTISHIPYHAYL